MWSKLQPQFEQTADVAFVLTMNLIVILGVQALLAISLVISALIS
jgi:hypothetical protein